MFRCYSHHHQGEHFVRYLKTISCHAATMNGCYDSYVIIMTGTGIYVVAVVVTIDSSYITVCGF